MTNKINTNTNNIKSLTVEEVKKARESGAPAIFNMVAAMAAAEEASLCKPARVGGGRTSQYFNTVKQIIESATKPLTMAAIQAAYFAGTGTTPDKKEAKKIYEAVYQHCDVCRNKGFKPENAVFTRDNEGRYSSLK